MVLAVHSHSLCSQLQTMAAQAAGGPPVAPPFLRIGVVAHPTGDMHRQLGSKPIVGWSVDTRFTAETAAQEFNLFAKMMNVPSLEHAKFCYEFVQVGQGDNAMLPHGGAGAWTRLRSHHTHLGTG